MNKKGSPAIAMKDDGKWRGECSDKKTVTQGPEWICLHLSTFDYPCLDLSKTIYIGPPTKDLNIQTFRLRLETSST